MPDDDIPPISESPEPVIRPRPPGERPQVTAAEREAVLKVEAAALLSRPVNGAWTSLKLRHACGTPERLCVTWSREGTLFVGDLVDGTLKSLDVYPGRG